MKTSEWLRTSENPRFQELYQTLRQIRIDSYTRRKKFREEIRELYERVKDTDPEEAQRCLNTLNPDPYPASYDDCDVEPDWDLLDRISYEEIPEYLDKGLLKW